VISIETDGRGKLYEDNLCIFRCYHLTLKHVTVWRNVRSKESGEMERKIKSDYYPKWRQYIQQKRNGLLPKEPKKYRGVQFSDIFHFEECFDISINIYKRDETNVLTPFYLSTSERRRKSRLLNTGQ